MIHKLIASFKYSLDGLRSVYKKDVAFRQEIFLLVSATLLIYIFNISKTEKIILFSSIFLILIIELLNSAVEFTVDRISKEHHILAKNAKDAASAAVFLSIINAFITWTIILL